MTAQYAIVRGERVTEAPVSLRSRYNGVGGFHLLTDEERKQYGWYPCFVTNESYNPLFENRSIPNPVFDPVAEVVNLDYTITDRNIESIKLDMKRIINDNADAALESIIAEYPEREVFSFSVQEAEARAWTLDNTVDTPLIDSIAAGRGLLKADLTALIIAKSNAFAALSGYVFGYRQKLEKDVELAADITELKALDLTIDVSQI